MIDGRVPKTDVAAILGGRELFNAMCIWESTVAARCFLDGKGEASSSCQHAARCLLLPLTSSIIIAPTISINLALFISYPNSYISLPSWFAAPPLQA
jgi:hypothetical protein